jgi:hypothetical protein
MTTRLNPAPVSLLERSLCFGLALAACGGRAVAGETDGDEGSSSDDTDPSSTITLSTDPATTDPATTDTLTTDPATTDPGTDSATTDVDSSGNPETTGSPTDSCCEVHGTAGCEEEEVATCVCKASPDCCVFEWADNCVEAAINDCGATCEDPTESSGEESSTGEPATDCEETLQIELSAEDATLDGFELVKSSFPEEGIVAGVIMEGMNMPEGTVTWDIDIPCNDDWHIWVRGRNAGEQDSFFARQDGGPDPAPIFELDCGGGNDYVWRELNWRDPEMGMPCEYVEDPWLAQWDAGAHEFQLEYRESPAVARIVVTNDDAFVPE